MKYLIIIFLLFWMTGCEMKASEHVWPDDVNGNVFRSLERHGFDFSKEHLIDINLDFDHWPLTEEELSFIRELYPQVEVIHPEKGEDIGNGVDVGFLQFQVKAILSYAYITDLQEEVTNNISSIGGWCTSWGVLQE